MKYTLDIIRTSDGACVTRVEDWRYDHAGFKFYWTGGNCGCDCNRALYFERTVVGDEHLDVENTPCGSWRYTVPFAIAEDGTRIPLDEDPVVAQDREAERVANQGRE